MAGAAELFNGERVVVFLFLSRVLFSVPTSLAYEAVALCLLAAAGLLIEISVENSAAALDRFKTRLGAASGILLATVTLPSLMFCRLIQMSREISNHETRPEWISYFSLNFWAACSCCFAVLCLFCFMMQQYSQCISNSLCWKSRVHRYTLLCMVAFGLTCYLSFARKSSSEWYIIMNLSWLFGYGLTTIICLKHVLSTFPHSASLGEALLISSGIVLCFGDLLTNALSKMDSTCDLALFDFLMHDSRSEISTIIQGVLVSLLLFPVFYKLCLWLWGSTNFIDAETHVVGRWMQRGIGSSIVFYASLSILLTLILPAWLNYIGDIPMHPLRWVLNFLFTESHRRIALCIYWILVVYISVCRFYYISKNSMTERILLRKYYHLVAVLMFVPALIFEPDFLDLAFGAALAVFFILEMIRVWRIWPLGHMVHQFMNAFTDHRDSEILIVSHFSLLLGCAIPKWMSSTFNDRPLAPFAGILSLGIGDTMASMVGHKYGVLRWSKTGKKTIEGTAAGITSVFASCSVLLPLLASTGYILSQIRLRVRKSCDAKR
ncbi:hypothetical protein HPP92_025496 [Vanilla planifolia]|uniref:dolichol kinase n=1 Tax=Vanilla planifolia TaxID=51239 RepID=A0A835PG20_VANPL|nr:hypothetical protein HPP92_025805 [Vanilla planifolia]KAG0454192.1 hypothetical protein HPP92_025496 [Vanilla planifolia]